MMRHIGEHRRRQARQFDGEGAGVAPLLPGKPIGPANATDCGKRYFTEQMNFLHFWNDEFVTGTATTVVVLNLTSIQKTPLLSVFLPTRHDICGILSLCIGADTVIP